MSRQVLLLEDGLPSRSGSRGMRPGGRSGKLNFSATSIETLRHMVVAGIGVTLIPERRGGE